MVYPPPGVPFVHDLLNKPLSSTRKLQDLENNGDSLQDLLSIEVTGTLELRDTNL